jgi:hypothetical protein
MFVLQVWNHSLLVGLFSSSYMWVGVCSSFRRFFVVVLLSVVCPASFFFFLSFFLRPCGRRVRRCTRMGDNMSSITSPIHHLRLFVPPLTSLSCASDGLRLLIHDSPLPSVLHLLHITYATIPPHQPSTLVIIFLIPQQHPSRSFPRLFVSQQHFISPTQISSRSFCMFLFLPP